MKFRPLAVPAAAPAELRAWLADTLRGIADTLAEPEVVRLHLSPRAAAPDRISEGDVVFADGTNWNPGSGAGVYARISGAWVKL